MKFNIVITYEDKPTPKNDNYELHVGSEFCDDSAKLVSEVLAHFNQKFVEHKNNVRLVESAKIDTGAKK